MAVAPDHAELSEQLNAYLDRALDDVTRRRLERHLAACAACRLDLEQLRATREALRSLPQLEAPRSFTIPLATPERGREATPAVATPVQTRPPPSGGQPVPTAAVTRPWLAWTWRLGSLGAAACLLLAVVTSTMTPSAPGAATAFDAPASAPAGGAPAGPPASLANRDSAQRTSPAQPAPAAENSAARAAQGAAGAPSPAPIATPDEAPAQSAQDQAGSRLQQPAQATQAPPSDQSGFAPAQPNPPARPPVSVPAVTPSTWLSLAFVLALGSAGLYVYSRREGRRDAGAPGEPGEP